jgi:hypothetical protein
MKINEKKSEKSNPDLHQSDKLDPDPDTDLLQFADDKSKCMDYEPRYFSTFLRFRVFNSELGSGSASG